MLCYARTSKPLVRLEFSGEPLPISYEMREGHYIALIFTFQLHTSDKRRRLSIHAKITISQNARICILPQLRNFSSLLPFHELFMNCAGVANWQQAAKQS